MSRESSVFETLTGVAGAIVSLAAFMATPRELRGHFSIYSAIAVSSAVFTAIYSVTMSRRRQRILRNKRIFIIYSHQDLNAATALVDQLKKAGFDPWFDQAEIAAGQRIDEALKSGLAQSAIAILLVSEHMAQPSEWITREIAAALTRMPVRGDAFSPIIPVRLDETPIPPQLNGVSGIQWKSAADFARLEKGLHLALGT